MADKVESESHEPADAPLDSPPGQPAFIGPWWCRRSRPPYPPPADCRRVYIPLYGFLDADDQHRARVDRVSHLPMLILALLVLPILAYEFIPPERYPTFARGVLTHPAMALAFTAAMGFIWFAFLVEFVVKISIAPSRLKYATKNWLDVLIILLPLLRPLRGARALRGVRVLQTTKLARLSRVFTLRGVAMKLLRTVAAMVIGMELVRRIRERHKPPPTTAVPKPDYAQWPRTRLIAEINRLAERVRELESEGTPNDRDHD